MSTHRQSPVASGSVRLLRVLLVEDSPPDAMLVTRALERGGFEVVHERVDTAADMESALKKRRWDLVLADHSMPRFSAHEALALVKKQGLDLPFIIVSGHIEEETAVAAMKSGAHDYIMKERLARLVPAVERELREAEVRRAGKKSEEELRRAHEELELRVEKRTAALKATNAKLQNALEERRRLENELLEIAENERRRIGFDLHDDLGQKLMGVSLMIKGLERRLVGEQHSCAPDARRIQSLIQEITDHTHNLARQFGSLDARGDDLATVLKAVAGNAKAMFEIGCEFKEKGTIPALPQNTILQLYKICQEAVTNSIKHGKARQVSIGLAGNGDELVLTIKNDGLPFAPPEGAKNRMGLRIMNYRARTIGATLEIKPLKKSGTIVTCVLSMKNGSKTEPAASALAESPPD